MTLRPPFALLLLLLGLPAGAHGADYQPAGTPVPPDPVSSGYIVTVTGTVQAEPRFPGSDRFTVFGYPGIDFRRVGEAERFTAPDDGFGITLFESPFFRFGPVARYRGGRDRDDGRELAGLRTVDWTIEGGAFLEIWPVEFLRARGEIRYGFLGHEGVVGNVGLDLFHQYGAFTVTLGPRLAFGDERFTDEFFGVTRAEAKRNGRVTPFDPDGGVTSAGGLASVSYRWSQQVSTTAFAGYDRLVEDAGRSPIPRKLGSRDQYTLGASLHYSFHFGGF